MIVFVYPPDWVFVLLIICGVLCGIAWVCMKCWRWFTDPDRRKAALIRSVERAEQRKRDKHANSIRIEEATQRLAVDRSLIARKMQLDGMRMVTLNLN